MISAWRKDEMRTKLKAVKKLVDDAEKEKKNAMMQQGSWFWGCYLVITVSYTHLTLPTKLEV